MWKCEKCNQEFYGTPLTDTVHPICEACQHRKTLITALAKEYFFFLSDTNDLNDDVLREVMDSGRIPPCKLRDLAASYITLQGHNLDTDRDLFELLYCVVIEALGAGDIKPGPQRAAILEHFGLSEAQEEPEKTSASFPTYQEFVAGLEGSPNARMKFRPIEPTPPLAYAAGYEHGMKDGRDIYWNGSDRVDKTPLDGLIPPATELPPSPAPKCGVTHKRPEGEMRCNLHAGHPGEWHSDACGLQFQVRG